MRTEMWIAIAISAGFLLLFRDSILGLVLPRRLTGTAYLIKELRGWGVDPHLIGLASMREVVDAANKLSRYQSLLKDKTRSEWFIQNLEVSAKEIADVMAGRRPAEEKHWIDEILIKNGVIKF